jgi:hypothetical protein
MWATDDGHGRSKWHVQKHLAHVNTIVDPCEGVKLNCHIWYVDDQLFIIITVRNNPDAPGGVELLGGEGHIVALARHQGDHNLAILNLHLHPNGGTVDILPQLGGNALEVKLQLCQIQGGLERDLLSCGPGDGATIPVALPLDPHLP